MTSEHHPHKSLVLGIILACTGHAFFNISDAALKLVALKFHFSQIMCINSVLTIILLSCYGWMREGKKAFQTKKMKMMLARGFFAQIITVCNIFALPHVPLSTFYTLVFTSPLWVALISAYFFNDRLSKRGLVVILAGFAVILFVYNPGSGMFNAWALVVLLGAFIYSWQLVLMRELGQQESRVFMVLIGAVMSIAWTAPFLPAHYIAPTPYEWGIFVMMSVVVGVGLLCMAYGFQIAPSASSVAPYHYTQIFWGTLLGYFIFKEIPDARTMAGAAFIIIAGLYIILGETRRKPVPV